LKDCTNTSNRVAFVMKANDFSRQHLINLPNILTYLRMAIIPVIIVVLLAPVSTRSFNIAFLLFVLATITDYLDGILARSWNLVTSVGKLLDPLADKLLTSAVLIMLIPVERVPAWLVFLIIGRELTITGLRSIAASQGLIIKASRMGKNKMISQTIAIALLLLTIPHVQGFLHGLGLFFLWVSVILSFWSAMEYFVNFYREAKRHSQQAT